MLELLLWAQLKLCFISLNVGDVHSMCLDNFSRILSLFLFPRVEDHANRIGRVLPWLNQ